MATVAYTLLDTTGMKTTFGTKIPDSSLSSHKNPARDLFTHETPLTWNCKRGFYFLKTKNLYPKKFHKAAMIAAKIILNLIQITADKLN